ncbi:hypothetical protein R6Q59_005187 [Mikania micrantha]
MIIETKDYSLIMVADNILHNMGYTHLKGIRTLRTLLEDTMRLVILHTVDILRTTEDIRRHTMEDIRHMAIRILHTIQAMEDTVDTVGMAWDSRLVVPHLQVLLHMELTICLMAMVPMVMDPMAMVAMVNTMVSSSTASMGSLASMENTSGNEFDLQKCVQCV